MKITVALLLLLSVHLVWTSQCQDGWQLILEQCYLFVDKEVTWQEAMDTCAKNKTNLHDTSGGTKFDMLLSQMRHRSLSTVWLACKNEPNTRVWNWQPSGEKTDFMFKWSDAEIPILEQCCLLDRGYGGPLKHAPCADKKKFACQKPAAMLWKEFQGQNYTFFYTEPRTWQTAQAKCAENQAHLPVIENALVDQWLRAEMDTIYTNNYWVNDPWIGGKYVPNGKYWEWQPSGQRITYFNWAPSEPRDPTSEQCIGLLSSHGHKWIDVSCRKESPFACQKPVLVWEVFQGKNYMFFNKPQTWEEAKATCAQENAHLPVIDNPNIGPWLAAQINKHSLNHLWIAYKYDANSNLEGHDTKNPFSEYCIEMYSDAKITFGNIDCRSKNAIVCERSY